ncbi:ankyrin repeat-containing protein [Cavenderia fasciculata]|uniref:Ankyrin repeat-containing protein n=1 Tax=Cavenderia fasciculata TaxID=261658 RepID=F4PNR6_CACFS|nr:ankyrin repeat-containing protein [Cavenderia fasciculata]EGG23119.1 ankyrin repeat-containing protein [Cavenderia fasciculata]|eukprot:XP_004360970.1 ankyrin repeat-containing protein [Cavenderia fasciculata]
MNFSPTSNSDSLSISPPSVASSFLLSQITNSNSISSGNLMLQQPPQQQQKQQHNSTENMTSSDDIDPLAEVVVDRDDESMSQVSPITSNESPDECNIHSQKFELLDHQPEPQQSQQQSNNNDQLLQKEKEEEETVVVEVEEKKQDDENVILIEKRFVDDEEELVVVTQCEESQLDKTEEECGGGVTPTTASLLTSSLTTPVSASLLLDLQPLCLKQLMLQNNNSPTQQSQQQQPPLSPTNTMVVSSPPSFGKLIETSSDILCTTPNGSIITTTTTTTTTTITTTTTTYGGAGGQPTSSSANCASPPSSSSILEEMMKPDVFSISGPLGNSSDKTTAVVLAIGSSSPKELSGADQSPTSAAANATQIQSIPIVIEPSPLPVTVAPAQVVVVAEQQPPVLVISPPPISSKPSKSNQMMNTTPPMRRRCTSAPVIRPRLQRQSRQKPQHSMSEKPLLHAVLVQEEIKTLVNNDDINTRDNSGNSVLHRVSIIGHPFAIKHVIGRGARVNSVNNSGMTPLHYAACSNPHCVEVLLCYGSLLNSRDARGDTPLHYAVERGQQQIVSYLLFKGAKVNIINKIMERSAIHIASLKGYHTIIKLLLDYKINVNAADCNLSTPLHLVVYHSPQPNVSINPATYSQSAFTINSNMESYATCCEILLQRGADVYSQDIQGYTPLHIASRQGKRNLVDIILDYGKGYKGKLSPSVSANLPPSLYDKSKFKKEIKSELLLYIMDNKGRLPIHMAAIGGHGRILESMIGNGNKCLAIKDDMGMTPLCLASLLGNFDCVEFIYTIDPGLRNQYFKFFASSIDCSKSPFDPLGNDLKFALDGDYCDLVFSVDGREIYAHSVIVRQFKCFREMISYNKPMMMVMSGGGGAGGPSNNSSYYTAMSNSLHPNSAAAQHHPYYHHNPNGTYGFGGGQAGHALVSGSSYSRSQDDASSSSYNDYYDDDYSYNESSLSGTANHLNQMMGGAGGGRARSRSRQGSVTNPSTLLIGACVHVRDGQVPAQAGQQPVALGCDHRVGRGYRRARPQRVVGQSVVLL